MVPKDTYIEKLAYFTAELNEATDTLNETLTEFEQKLVDANVGIEWWVKRWLTETVVQEWVPPDYADDGEIWRPHICQVIQGQQLGWAKVDGTWRLAVRAVRAEVAWPGVAEAEEVEFKSDKEQPLVNTSREFRIKACGLLDDLVRELCEHAESYLVEVRKAQRLVKGLSAGQPTEDDDISF